MYGGGLFSSIDKRLVRMQQMSTADPRGGLKGYPA